jgi:hypothetical protein
MNAEDMKAVEAAPPAPVTAEQPEQKALAAELAQLTDKYEHDATDILAKADQADEKAKAEKEIQLAA